MFLPGTGVQNWIKWKCRYQCFFRIHSRRKNGGWKGRVCGERWRFVQSKRIKEEGDNKGLGVWQPLRWFPFIKTFTSPTLCLYVSVHVMYMMTLFSVLAGRCCLCVALWLHLFLARLLISVLIISCLPVLCLVSSVLYPILCHPSIQSSIYPSILLHLKNSFLCPVL